MLLYYITDRRQFPGDERAQRRALLAKIAEAARCGVDFIQLREKDLSARELESLAHEAVQIVRASAVYAKPEARNSKLLVNSRADIALAAGADGVHLPASDISASDARALWETATRDVKRETRNATIAVSCHTLEEVLAAESHGADFAVFGPIFEKISLANSDVARPPGSPSRADSARDGVGVPSAGQINVPQPPSAVQTDVARPPSAGRGRVAQPPPAGGTGIGLAMLREVCRRGLARDPKTESVASGRMPVLALGGITAENARACLAAGAAGLAGIRLFQQNDVAEIVQRLRS